MLFSTRISSVHYCRHHRSEHVGTISGFRAPSCMSALSICAMRCVKQLIRTHQTWLQKPLKELGAQKGRLALYSYFTVIQMPHVQLLKTKAAQVLSRIHETPKITPGTWGGIRRTDWVVHQQGERQRLPERQAGQAAPPATG